MTRAEVIRSSRLVLVLLKPEALRLSLVENGAAVERLLGLAVPPDWYEGAGLIKIRLQQITSKPAYQPWNVRAISLREQRQHGAFYSHFEDKGELVQAALVHALDENRKTWIGQPQTESWRQRLARLAKRYLTPGHRQQLSECCALAARVSESKLLTKFVMPTPTGRGS